MLNVLKNKSVLNNNKKQLNFPIINNFILKLNLKITKNPLNEPESSEYEACTFSVENKDIIFRVAKTTPKKIGQFVTLWKRTMSNNNILPLDIEDHFKFVIIYVYNDKNSGIFFFNKNILAKNEIISLNNIGGKRAIRVYPPWCTPTSKQATSSQKWQCEYYISLNQTTENEINLFKNILNS